MKLLPGQREFVKEIYGRVAKDGRRQIRIAIKSEPSGNGKTGLLAGLALCHLLGPECEPRGEVYSCAYNKLQAALIFAEMKAIIEAVPEFEARCNLQRYGKIIEVLEGDGAGSIYEILSADDKRAHGLSPSFWIFDEFAQARIPICSTTCERPWASAAKVWVLSSRRRRPTTCIRSRR